LTFVCLAVVVPLGFGLKIYRAGPGHSSVPLQHYLNNSLAGVAYEVFWCLLAFLIWPRRRAIVPICVSVFVATTALEFLQLWHPASPNPLEAARSTFLGRALLGTTFSWMDIPHYAAGCLIGAMCLVAILQSDRATRDEHNSPGA
jgi:hypothetical protein